MITFDFHSHTNYQDGINTAPEMVEGAIAKGLTIYGISEHSPRLPAYRYRDDPPGEVRGLKRFPEYLVEMEVLKKQHVGKIELLKATEVDWLGVEHLESYKAFIAEGKYDYTIGSVHFLGTLGFDYIGDWEAGVTHYPSVTAMYERYYAEYAVMVRSGLFDIGGHLDLIKKFDDQYPLEPGSDPLQLALPALDALAESNMVMELSSAGLVKPCKDWYPALPLLRAARVRDIPITLNSDAHSVARIAEGFPQAIEFAKSAGYSEVVVFHQGGERETVKLA